MLAVRPVGRAGDHVAGAPALAVHDGVVVPHRVHLLAAFGFMVGWVRFGQVRLGQVRSGQVRSGSVRLGSVSLGSVR